MVLHQTEQGALDVVAESPLRRVGLAEAALDEAQGELLGQVLGHRRVADGPQQVAVDGAAVALHQHLASLGRGIGLAPMGLEEDRPLGGDLAEVLLDVVLVHRWSSG